MTDIVERLREFAGPRYPDDICGKACMGEAADEIEWLRGERLRLAADLAEAHKAILPWIDDVGWLNAEYARHTDALRRIAMPGKDVDCTKEGHMVAVLIARDALKEDAT